MAQWMNPSNENGYRTKRFCAGECSYTRGNEASSPSLSRTDCPIGNEEYVTTTGNVIFHNCATNYEQDILSSQGAWNIFHSMLTCTVYKLYSDSSILCACNINNLNCITCSVTFVTHLI